MITTSFNLIGTCNISTTDVSFARLIGTYTLNENYSKVIISEINSCSVTCNGFSLAVNSMLPATLEDTDTDHTNIAQLSYDQGHSTFFGYIKAIKDGKNVEMRISMSIEESPSDTYEIIANASVKCKAYL